MSIRSLPKVCFKCITWCIWDMLEELHKRPGFGCDCHLAVWHWTGSLISLSNNGSLIPNLHRIVQKSTEKEIWNYRFRVFFIYFATWGKHIIGPGLEGTWRPCVCEYRSHICSPGDPGTTWACTVRVHLHVELFFFFFDEYSIVL